MSLRQGHMLDFANENEGNAPEFDESSDEVVVAGGNWREKVSSMASQVAAREGCEIYDIEFVGNAGNRTLRVFVDRTDGAGVTVEDCSNVSRGLNLLLDVDDIIPGGAYNLEVSSPGLERPLRTSAHYRRAVGARVQVKVFESFADMNPDLDQAARTKLGKAKQLEGKIVAVEGDEGASAEEKRGLLTFDAENGGQVIRVRVPLSKVTKANTVFVFEKNEKKQGKKN